MCRHTLVNFEAISKEFSTPHEGRGITEKCGWEQKFEGGFFLLDPSASPVDGEVIMALAVPIGIDDFRMLREQRLEYVERG